MKPPDQYPLLCTENVVEAIMFKDDLSSKFEPNNLNFMVSKRGEFFCVICIDDEVDDALYLKVYQYAQKIFVNFYT